MDTILSVLKSYFLLVLILLVLSYMVPKQSYRKYFQFFVSILMVLILFRPVFSWMRKEDTQFVYENLEEVSNRLEEIEFEAEQEDIFELFFLENNTE